MSKVLKVGVLGAGHLGKIHLRLLNESEKYDLVGFFDEQPEVRTQINKEYGFRAFESVDALLDSVRAVYSVPFCGARRDMEVLDIFAGPLRRRSGWSPSVTGNGCYGPLNGLVAGTDLRYRRVLHFVSELQQESSSRPEVIGQSYGGTCRR